MKGIELFYNQIPPESHQKQTNKRINGETTDFGQLLMKKIATVQSLTTSESQERINILDMLSNLQDNHLNVLFWGGDNIDEVPLKSLIDSELNEKLPETIRTRLKGISSEITSVEEFSELLATLGMHLEQDGDIGQGNEQTEIELLMTDLPLIDMDKQMIVKQLNNGLKEIQNILARLITDQNIRQATPQTVDLIEKWLTLERTAHQKNIPLQSITSQLEVDDETLDIWKDLLQSFQKRSTMAHEQQQRSNFPDKHQDISKWITDALPRSNKRNISQLLQQASPSSQVSLSELEQYVIHMSASKGTQTAEKQLLDQFQNIIKTSRFSSNNKINQLFISLKPQNMGDMVVRLTQVDGEMTVKIIVSSSMTRQMLESNMQELRHMFSPHQVVIEEKDIESQDIQESFKDETAYDEEDNHSNPGNDDEEHDNNNDFETTFLNLLMNEKV